MLPLYNKIGFVDLGRTSKDNLFLILSIVLIGVLPEKARKVPWAMCALAGYVILSVIHNQVNPASVIVMMQSFYIVGGVVLFIAFYEKHDQKSLNYILNGMAIGAILQSIFGIANFFSLNLYERIVTAMVGDVHYIRIAVSKEIVGSLGHSNLLGSYVALTVPAFFRPKWVWLLPLPVLLVSLSQSLMGIGASFCACIYWLNSQYKVFDRFTVYLLSILGMLLLFAGGVGGADSQRFSAWKRIFSVVDLKHFLFGKGPGWFALQRLNLVDGIMGQEHSGFISVFNVIGILAFALIMPVFCKYLLQEEREPIFHASLYASFCSSFGHFTLHQSTVAIIIIVMAAICLAEGNKDELNLER